MNNAGLNKPDDKPKHTDNTEAPARRSPLLVVLLAGVTVISLVIGFQAFGILYSIIFPPAPPLPEAVIEIRHDNIDYGVDDWLYRTSMNACDLVRFYEIKGGECRIVANMCDDDSAPVSYSNAAQQVATCSGEVIFNIFAYRWEANIAVDKRFEDGETQFNLLREVFWTGAVPPKLDPGKGLAFDN